MKKLLLAGLLGLLRWPVLAQSVYYVDGAAGNDANAGTALTTAWRTLQQAGNAAPAGSTVQVRGGTYRENWVVRVSGTPTRPITFRAYRRETVLVDGTGTPGSTLLQVSNQSYLRFEHLTFQNLTRANAQGIRVETTGPAAATDLVFRSITIRRIAWTASAGTVPTATDNAQGFVAYGRQGGLTRLTLDSCEVSDNVLGFSEALTLDGNIDGFLIQHCRVHDNTNIGIDLAGHYGVCPTPTTDAARNGQVRRNACYRNVSAYATSGGIYVDGGRDIAIDGNRCSENGWGIEVGAEENGNVTNITVSNNLVFNNQAAGLALGGYTTTTTGQVLGSTVRNNTFLFNNANGDGTGEVILTKASGCRLENNLFYTTAQSVLFTVETIAPQANNALNYNSWYTSVGNANSLAVNWRGTTYASFAAYRAATGQDTNSRFGDPGLVRAQLPLPDLRLRATSACRDAGNPATALAPGETDFAGGLRVVGPVIDLGAYEFGSGGTLGTAASHHEAPALALFPNPAAGLVQVQAPFAAFSAALYNGAGQRVRQPLPGTTTLNLNDLPPGLYLLRVTSPTGQTLTRRFFKE